MEMHRLMEHVERMLRQGNVDSAVEGLRQILSQDPDHAAAHALLAHCLVARKRLHAARNEVGMALTLEPELPQAHDAAFSVALLSRDLKTAEKHLDTLFSLVVEDADLYLMKARLMNIKGKRAEKEAALEKARALEPDNVSVMIALGEHLMSRGQLDQAFGYAFAALQNEPENQEGLVLMGYLKLRRGDLEGAREQLQWALRQDPTDQGALHLLTAIKARESLLLGMWWRMMVKLNELGEKGVITVLLGAFFVYRVMSIWLDQIGKPGLGSILSFVWLGLCIYTWVAPQFFRRALRKELKAVILKDDF
ncbi:MAG: tetratricopeptide repeat protein [Acidobacteriota bacterium]|nr:tetratricopeptide repeat protein [Acidobacteriota bacterium]